MKIYKEVNTVGDLLKMTGNAYALGTRITQDQLDKLFALLDIISISEKDFQDLCKLMLEIIAPKAKEPVCPHCKTTLEVTNTYDEEFDNDTIIEMVKAECPNCHKEFTYNEYYTYSGYDELQEDN